MRASHIIIIAQTSQLVFWETSTVASWLYKGFSDYKLNNYIISLHDSNHNSSANNQKDSTVHFKGFHYAFKRFLSQTVLQFDASKYTRCCKYYNGTVTGYARRDRPRNSEPLHCSYIYTVDIESNLN